ncbi:hypothetical protein LEN26_002670 [Aphanomyces euteiches]|nr:hypothetical protein AeMF1_015538 [Aphanomyces euteiches]KAH9158860.1 hypothetical protein LEN26_002670 [Aphanomyces euteiches]KAH9186636.1 hypothetical protein AeNC1_011384 [Aphanomyces euteiches]
MLGRLVLAALMAARLCSGEDIQQDVGAEIHATGNAGLAETFNHTIQLGKSTRFRIAYPNARFIYVHFSKFDLPKGDSLTLSTKETTVVYTGRGRRRKRNSGDDDDTSFYSDRLEGDAVNVLYKHHGGQTKGHYGVTIGSYIRGVPRMDRDGKSLVNPTCVSNEPSWKPAVCYKKSHPKAFESSRALARMVTVGPAGAVAQYSTGFLVGCDGYFLTNEHNVRTQDQVDSTDFGFLAASADCDDTCNRRALGCSHKLLVRGSATLIAVDTTLDYALLRFHKAARRQIDAIGIPYLRLRDATYRAETGDEIYVPQHPDGTAAKIVMTLKNGTKATITSTHVTNKCGKDQLGYMAETIGGSSGSPVISMADHRVVGLHHCGECNTGSDGDMLRTAIPIHKILAHLQANQDIELPACFSR